MEVKVTLGIDKLIEVSADGIGAIAGPMLAEWKAKKEGNAKIITAEADAKVALIRANAHSKARKLVLENHSAVHGEIIHSDSTLVTERIQYQEQKRLANIKSVVSKAAHIVGNQEVPDTEPDHDWTARFFSEVQDVSSEDMQILWAKLLAGEVQKPKSASIRSLGILREMDANTAGIFRKFCSMCMFLELNDRELFDGRVPALGKDAAHNSLQTFGLSFSALNQLQEYGLIIPDFNAWMDYSLSVWQKKSDEFRLPFRFQNKKWWLIQSNDEKTLHELKINGPSLSLSGLELSNIVECVPMPEFNQQLQNFFQIKNLQMKTQLQSERNQ